MPIPFPAAHLPVAAYFAPGPAEDEPVYSQDKPVFMEDESALYFIELRYRQYLAEHALRELFESGELNGLVT
jgi:hypothetical protein